MVVGCLGCRYMDVTARFSRMFIAWAFRTLCFFIVEARQVIVLVSAGSVMDNRTQKQNFYIL